MTIETDHELLELAAKAAGIGPLDFDYAEREGHKFYFGPRLPLPQGIFMAAMHRYWNPLTDDGDAFRLLVKCGLTADVDIVKDNPNDTCNALRRAIVRAAAEIGRSMV